MSSPIKPVGFINSCKVCAENKGKQQTLPQKKRGIYNLDVCQKQTTNRGRSKAQN
jgi:hypothetical protein